MAKLTFLWYDNFGEKRVSAILKIFFVLDIIAFSDFALHLYFDKFGKFYLKI